MTSQLSTNATLHELIALIESLDKCASPNRQDVAQLRQQMDRSCDQGEISLAEWKQLLEKIKSIQERLMRE